MKTGSQLCKKLAIIKPLKAKSRRCARKLRIFFFGWKTRALRSDALLAHFELPLCMLDEPFPPSLTSHIELLRLIGYQVKVTPVKKQTSTEDVGLLSCYRAGRLEFQEELLIRSVAIEKIEVVSKRIFPINQQSEKIADCNN